ncbi:MAG: RNA-directed DNA polymerase [Verrucomicrobiae bacterium]|nr:RNA-directed DNA polymerase [Verrucomicrobiae bacterium]
MADPDPSQPFRPLSRQEIYDAIKATSKQEFILDDMIRLGFWMPEQGNPAVPDAIIRRRGELNRELNELLHKQRRFENREAALAAHRKKRMAESKVRQKETKERNARLRQEKAERWRERKQREILYLGEGVSGGLSELQSVPERLSRHQLPDFANAETLASAMGITLGELSFLAFHREVSKTTHYRRFAIPKKSGGERIISAPMPRLKAAQTWILENLLQKVSVHDAAHGFVPDRSIITNASNHIGRDIVINVDLQNFFPSVTQARTKGLFKSLGYSEHIATILSLLCTEPEMDTLELDGQIWHVAMGGRFLPQGSPASPAITNILCRKFDARLSGMARKLGFTYTRYADDVTFSAGGETVEKYKTLLWRAKAIIHEEGFIVHPDKLRIMRLGSRQEVTGLIVNKAIGIPREDLRRFRAVLRQVEQDGPAGKRWHGSGHNILAVLGGYVNFIHMVTPEKAAPLRERVLALQSKHGWQREIRHRPRALAPEAGNPAARSADGGGFFKSILRKLGFGK